MITIFITSCQLLHKPCHSTKHAVYKTEPYSKGQALNPPASQASTKVLVWWYRVGLSQLLILSAQLNPE